MNMGAQSNPYWATDAQASRPLQSVIADLEPTYREVFFSGLLALWFAAGMNGLPFSEDWINTIGLSAFSILLAWAAFRQMRRNIASLWTPLIWYRVTMLSYFGMGSMVPIWTNGETLDLMKSFYSFYGFETVKLNFLITTFNLCFIITVKTIFVVIGTRTTWLRSERGISKSNFSLIAFGSICLSVGAAVNYLIILPQTIGVINLTYFSSVSTLSMLSWFGYFMVVYWALENKKLAVLIAPILLSFGESGIGFLATSKAGMLMPLVMVSIGFIYHRPNLLRITAFGTAIVVIFMVLSPAVAYVRDLGGKYYDGSPPAKDIPGLYASYFRGEKEDDSYTGVEMGWARLSFVNAGTFVMNQYDHGMPGRSYRYWSIVWIPRIIYREKPIITDVARELTYAANGNYNSSASAGLAAEAYWNGGWPAAIGLSVFIAFVFGFWSIYSYEVIRRRAWHLFFIVLLGMRMAVRVDGAFVSDILGPLPLAILAHIALELMNRFLPQALAGVMRRPAGQS